jgi:gluconokinase
MDRSVILLMGVSGSGKTTVGALLARQLGWKYAEADSFHPPANIEKMAAGHPLDDEDRRPWLAAIATWIDATIAAGEPAVVTCSALKRAYRDQLGAGRPQVQMVYLKGDRDLIAARLAARQGHFFTAAMLDSQFADLEEPTADEGALVVSIAGTPKKIVEDILAALDR